MPTPSTSLASLRPDLAGSFMEYEYEAARSRMIAQQVFPVVESQKQAGKLGKIPIEELLKTANVTRASGASYPRQQYTFTTDSFSTVDYGIEEVVDDRDSAAYSDFFNAEQLAATRALHTVMVEAEKRIAAAVFDTAAWTGSDLFTNVGTEWSTRGSAVPLTNVDAAAVKVFAGCGMWPNALIMSRTVFRNLRIVDEILDMLKFQGNFGDIKPENLTPQMLAGVFDVDMIIVGGAAKNTANENQTAVIKEIWDDEYCMVAKVATGPDVREPCIGRIIHWAEDGSTIGGTMESYRDERARADIVRARHDVDEKRLYVEAGHLLGNIMA